MFIILFLISSLSFSQNWPACDSLQISCCEYNVFGPNTITITVTNNSSVLFDYPSFVLFDTNMDTVAAETVTYFGIGTNPQPHTLNIIAPLILPFTGYLNLYTLFGDTLGCSFPYNIPDTATVIYQIPGNNEFKIVTIPGDASVIINAGGFLPGKVSLKVNDFMGREIIYTITVANADGKIEAKIRIPEGSYIISLRQQQKYLTRKFIR